MNIAPWLARTAERYGSVTVVGLIAALLVVGGLVDDGDYWAAVVAGAVALIVYAAYVALVRDYLKVSWRTVERNAYRMGAVLALTALGLGAALSLLVVAMVAGLALRQLRIGNEKEPSEP